MDEKTDDETKTETEDTAEEKKVIEERMVKSVSPESSVGAVIGQNNELAFVRALKYQPITAEADMLNKTAI